MGQLTAGLSDLLVSWILLKYWAIRFPEGAEALALAVAVRNPALEPCAGLGRTVPDDKRHNLPGPAAEGYPQPPFIRPLSDACPAFIKFKDVVLLGWPEPISY